MYNSLQNQTINFGRYIFGYIVAFVIIPNFVLKKRYRDTLDSVVSNYIKMVLLFIISGYFLVITKLFELISIGFVLLSIFFLRFIIVGKFYKIDNFFASMNIWMYDYADDIVHPGKTIKNFIERVKCRFSDIVNNLFNNIINFINLIIGIFTTVYIVYIYFYDAFTHASPAMSDGYVTLAWMKYINGRILFHDGIYPQGFHINLAVIQKFAAINPLYVLKYTGPLNALLIAVGLCFVVYKLSGRFIPGIMTAIIYGILGNFLSNEWRRLAATNSQEFAYVFLIPTFYFFYRYIRSGKMRDFYTAFCGLAAMGLIHTIAFAFAGVGLFSVGIASLSVDYKRYFKRVFRAFLAGIACVVISIIPIGLGMLMGRALNSSASEFLIQKIINMQVPELSFFDYIAFSSIFIIFLYSIFIKKKSTEVLKERCIGFYGILTFGIYYAGGVLTKNVVLGTRSGSIWAIVSTMCIGMGIYVLFKVISNEFVKKIFETLSCTALIILTLIYIKPQPIVPYKMEWDSKVEQYLRISSSFRPSEWMIISQDDEYAIVLGDGYNMLIRNFLDNYNPLQERLGTTQNGVFSPLKTTDIFIYQDKKVFRSDFDSLKPEYERREKEKLLLEDWINKYKISHSNISVFYEDDNLKIFHIVQVLTKEESFNNIWQDVKTK